MIIDFHTHVFDSYVIENKTNFLDDQTFSILYSCEKSKLISHNTLIKAMDESNVGYAAAMGFPWEKEKYCEKQNKYFSSLKNSSKGRIIPFGSVPLNDKQQADDWAKYIKELGLAGIGEVAFYGEGLTYRTAGILEEVFAAGTKYSLPVCVHVSEPVGKDYTGKHSTDLSILYTIIKNFPSAVIILAHWGGGLFFYELMEETRASLKNVYYDTAASPYLYKEDIFEIAVRITGSKKILFGSDYPLINFKKYFDSINKVLNNEDDKKNICGENAAVILKNFLEKKL
ncbi:MAG: amidohydrolase family protein [Spirochaetes bacterium]|nr:amidohydrolase family protein [Spirochaetota bacterium]